MMSGYRRKILVAKYQGYNLTELVTGAMKG
jgi:hypothetical protein